VELKRKIKKIWHRIDELSTNSVGSSTPFCNEERRSFTTQDGSCGQEKWGFLPKLEQSAGKEGRTIAGAWGRAWFVLDTASGGHGPSLEEVEGKKCFLQREEMEKK